MKTSPICGALLCILVVIPFFSVAAFGQSKKLPVVIRDFNESHQDFQGQPCKGNPFTPGIVEQTLDPNRKPVLSANAPSKCKDIKLQEWFTTTPNSATYCKELVLEPVSGKENTYFKDDPLFFPIDDVPSAEMKYTSVDGKIHNFHFCMELHATFKYRGAEVFDFRGDDDVWVFVNNKLALDLGGEHGKASASVDLDKQATDLNILPGNYYNIDFFYCERQTTQSNLLITTSIDIIPPPAPGLHIADEVKNVIPDKDTITLYQFTGAKSFYAVKIEKQRATVECYKDLETQVKVAQMADWTLGGKALPRDSLVKIDPDAYNPDQVYPLAMKGIVDGKNYQSTIYIHIKSAPPLAAPAFNPAQDKFSGTLNVTITHPVDGVVLYYTDKPGAFSPETWTKYNSSKPIQIKETVTLQAIATKLGNSNSPVAVKTYTKVLSKAVSGYYLDADGDGRIETAVVLFDENFTTAPADVRFRDPFNAKTEVKPDKVTSGTRRLTATFAPFSPGTGFKPDNYGTIPVQIEFEAQSVRMDDSVGPMLIRAESFPAVDGTTKPEILVEFSEDVALDINAKAFPFEIKRSGTLIGVNTVNVESVEKISGSKYKFIFPPDSKYPVPKDSLRVAQSAGIKDLNGNRSNMKTFIPVDGKPAAVIADVGILIKKPVTEGSKINPKILETPLVFHNSFNGSCVNCDKQDIKDILQTADPSIIEQSGPSWDIKTKYPFRYHITIFDNLGQFVNTAEGKIEAQDFSKLKGSANVTDTIKVTMTFVPVSYEGRQLGTGAYIMKGEIQTLDGAEVVKGPQGEDLVVQSVKQQVFSRFGYSRKD